MGELLTNTSLTEEDSTITNNNEITEKSTIQEKSSVVIHWKDPSIQKESELLKQRWNNLRSSTVIKVWKEWCEKVLTAHFTTLQKPTPHTLTSITYTFALLSTVNNTTVNVKNDQMSIDGKEWIHVYNTTRTDDWEKTTLLNLRSVMHDNKQFYVKNEGDEEWMRLALFFRNFGPSTKDAVKQLHSFRNDLHTVFHNKNNNKNYKDDWKVIKDRFVQMEEWISALPTQWTNGDDYDDDEGGNENNKEKCNENNDNNKQIAANEKKTCTTTIASKSYPRGAELPSDNHNKLLQFFILLNATIEADPRFSHYYTFIGTLADRTKKNR